HAIPHLGEGLAAEVAVPLRVVVERGVLPRPAAPHLLPREPGPLADVRLDQPALDLDGHAEPGGDDLGRRAGAAERGTVHPYGAGPNCRPTISRYAGPL